MPLSGLIARQVHETGRMADKELDEMVKHLVDLELPFDPGAPREYNPYELVAYALNGTDYWADRALDWLDLGLRAAPVQGELRHLIDDVRRPQTLRHRALTVWKSTPA